MRIKAARPNDSCQPIIKPAATVLSRLLSYLAMVLIGNLVDLNHAETGFIL